MNFIQGTAIGPYIIEREIGRGGMGVVYLARDPRLDRYVAIKALPEHLATDPARLERFETEARSLAQLNHPNVAGILGLEEKDGQKFLILEYVEGESLAEWLVRVSPEVEEAVGVCVQIAAGIEAAHEAGVIHRDLKPDNIRITPDGDVKVLDFGLAKMADGPTTAASDEAIHEAPTIPTPQRNSPTMPGMIMGTAAYMSPEQARGHPVDKRTDIWSFGVLLFECLSGAGPFLGETASDTIGAVLHKDIDYNRLPGSTPPMVKHVLGGCLERDKSVRYRDIGDVRIELERSRSGAGGIPKEPRPGPARPAVIGLVLAVSLLTAAAAWFGKPAAPPIPLPVVNSEISLPDGIRMAHRFHPGLAISPDGQTIAFPYGNEPAADSPTRAIRCRGLMLRHLDQPEPIPVAGLKTRSGTEPVFSPDGQWIAYWAHDGIHKVPVSGGQSIKISPAMNTSGITWGDDDSIVAGLISGGLVRFPSKGGNVDTLTVIDTDANELSHRLPHFIPGSDVLLFTVSRFGWQQKAPGAWSVWALRISTRERVLVVEQASDARFVNGHVVFMREGSLFAIPFDPIGLAVTGAPRQVLEGVQHSVYFTGGSFESGAGMYAISTSGTLVYCPGSVAPESKWPIVRVDREGNETPLDIRPRQYYNLRGSPDGKQLLLSSFYAPTSGIWIHDFESGVSRRQRVEGTGYSAVWGPGPDRITFDRTMDDGKLRLFNRIVGAQAADDLEIEFPGNDRIWIGDWSCDGKYLPGTNLNTHDLWSYTSDDGWASVMATGGLGEMWPALSPDGRWLASGAPESGRLEILVRPFPGPGRTAQVSRHGGTRPVWSRDGSEIFFRGRDAEGERSVMAAAVSENAGLLEFGLPRPLFKDEGYLTTDPTRSWDVLADGDFVFVKFATDEHSHQILLDLHANRLRVVQNWASTLAGDD